jgi:CspA family cold shock protein
MSNTAKVEERQVGHVKWFNNKAGYGFITMKKENGEDLDIFTHYSTIKMKDNQYRYLVQGEYVEFNMTDATNSDHQYQAMDVTGISGGPLMCETRQIARNVNTTRKPRRESDNKEKSDQTNSGDFVKVKRKRTQKKD